jgi:class 3 adenylate cyclase/CheY-like chemotaxis protein
MPRGQSEDAGVTAAAEPAAITDERLKQALLAHVREEFGAPVGAIIGYAEILLEEAPRQGLERFTPDLAKVHQAGLALQQLIDGLLDGHAPAAGAVEADYEAFRSKLRHDLRTPMNAIKGYGEMLLEDAEEAGAESVATDLKKMLASATRLLEQIDALVEFTAGESEQTAHDRPQLSKSLMEVIRPLPEGGAPARRVGPSLILAVDDHASNLDLLSRRLTREGHEVMTAGDGDTALRLVEENPFDLILLDLLMPGMSGYELLCRLKSHPRHCDLPVIVVSALDDIASVVRCIEAGAEDYIPKPFDPVLLRARINSCLERKHLRDRERMILEELRAEKEKSEILLLNILPKPIVERIQLGETLIADRVPDATILFADLVGFTGMAARLPPARLVELLNGLFTAFDRLSADFGLEKIKTIGDAYMVAGGILEQRQDHVMAVAEMGLAILDTVDRSSRQFGEPLQVRIGIHTGPVTAGVIGMQKFIYDIWGETVNTASRLESHGSPGKITVSADTYLRLRPHYRFGPSRIITLRGYGPMVTYFLEERAEAKLS